MNAESSFDPGARAEAAPVPSLTRSDAARHQPSFLIQFAQCLLVALLAYASYWGISHYLLQSVQVVGSSMTPTLLPSGYYFLNRWVYIVREPQPNDIVVIRDPSDNALAVKRIVAGAGDSICLRKGHVYVNGRELREPYLPRGTRTFAGTDLAERPLTCGPDQYFVLGDNRSNSADSRTYGPVPRQNILGTIVH